MMTEAVTKPSHSSKPPRAVVGGDVPTLIPRNATLHSFLALSGTEPRVRWTMWVILWKRCRGIARSHNEYKSLPRQFASGPGTIPSQAAQAVIERAVWREARNLVRGFN